VGVSPSNVDFWQDWLDGELWSRCLVMAAGVEERMATVCGRSAWWGVLVGGAVLASLVLAGCFRSSATPLTIFLSPKPGSASPATTTPAATTPAPARTGSKPGSKPVIGSLFVSRSAPDGSWTATINTPVIRGIPDAAAAEINDAVIAKVDSFIQAFAGSGLPAVASGGKPSTLEGDYSVALDSPTILSLRFTLTSTVSGATRPVEPGSINFDVPSGSTIALADIFTDPTAALSTLSTQAYRALSASLGSSLTWSGKATSMTFFEKAWAMVATTSGTPAGLEFTWAQGDIAGQSAGAPSVILPWASISSIIKPGGPAGGFLH
jgi:hypothetical protein